LQNDPENPILDRRVEIPSAINKSVVDELEKKFNEYKLSIK
jgi:hypothetical protein